jgi:hypothetical protein
MTHVLIILAGDHGALKLIKILLFKNRMTQKGDHDESERNS